MANNNGSQKRYPAELKDRAVKLVIELASRTRTTTR